MPVGAGGRKIFGDVAARRVVVGGRVFMLASVRGGRAGCVPAKINNNEAASSARSSKRDAAPVNAMCAVQRSDVPTGVICAFTILEGTRVAPAGTPKPVT